MSYQIQPFEKTETFTNEISSIRIGVYDLVLGVSAKITTTYNNDKGGCVYITDDLLIGDDYLNWGSDDNYIVNWICQKYNLTLI